MAIYGPQIYPGITGKPPARMHKTRNPPKTEPSLDIKIMAFILIFQPQKVLVCVSKIEFFKNPKILDRGDF